MFAVTGLAKAHGARNLFTGVTLSLNPGSRYGLVGANGSGKSTFLRVLAGDDQQSEGTISFPKRTRLGVLRQDRFLDDDARIIDLAMMGDEVVWQALGELRELESHPSPDAHRMVELEERVRHYDGYTLEARAARVLEGLGIPVAIQKQALRTLSGGFRLRVLLAQVLVGRPDLLLLDEPTNHLDILSIRWLEKFLATYTGCAVIVSHDQRFLDNVATHILDVDYETILEYKGNYTQFLEQKRLERERREAEIARQKEDIAEKKAFVERFRAKATKARQAQSRLKQIEKIEIVELAQSSRRTPLFRFTPARPSGKDVLTLEGVQKSYGEKRVLTGVSLVVRRKERVAIIGPNGVGKSTLLKIAVGRLQADAGKVEWGHETRVGYFAQEHRDLLMDPDQTALEVLSNARPGDTHSQVRGQLGGLLFSGDDVHKKVRSLSGGEAARLVFGLVAAAQPNVLVLDEPTNHLDLEAIEALTEALRTYDGTVIFVSHDRWFVSQLGTRIVEIREDGIQDFSGTYDEYLAKSGDDHLDAENVVLRAKNAKSAPSAPPLSATTKSGETPSGAKSEAPRELSWEEQKKQRNRRKELPKKRDQVMAEIEKLETRKAEIQALYAEPDFYMKTNDADLKRLDSEDRGLEQKIAALMKEWEALEAELESLGGPEAP